jgi:hypothetical protein
MSHHSSYDPTDPNNPERAAMGEAMKKLMGEFPNGKLNTQDEGGLAMTIGHENGAVVLKFPKQVAWVGFTPEQAAQIASDLMKHARACGPSGILTITL